AAQGLRKDQHFLRVQLAVGSGDRRRADEVALLDVRELGLVHGADLEIVRKRYRQLLTLAGFHGQGLAVEGLDGAADARGRAFLSESGKSEDGEKRCDEARGRAHEQYSSLQRDGTRSDVQIPAVTPAKAGVHKLRPLEYEPPAFGGVTRQYGRRLGEPPHHGEPHSREAACPKKKRGPHRGPRRPNPISGRPPGPPGPRFCKAMP